MILTELNRSVLKYFAPLLAFVPVLIIYTALRPGVFLWSDVTWCFNQASALINPIVVGVVAFAAARRSASGQALRLAGARRPTLATVTHFLSACIWIVLSQVAAFIYAATYLALNGGYGTPIWAWHLSTIAGTLLWATIGYLAGSLIGFRWYLFAALPLASYFIWLYVQGPAEIPYWVAQLYPTSLAGTNPFVRYIYTTIIGQILWCLGISVAILVVLARYGMRVRRLATLSLALVASGAGLLLIALHNGQFTTGYNQRAYVCSGSTPVICVQPAFSRGLPELETAFGSLDKKVSGTSLETTRLEQQVQGVGDEPSRGARSLYVEDLGPNFALFAVEGYVQRYAGSSACTDADPAVLHSIVDSWLSDERDDLVSAGGPVAKAARWFDSQSAEKKTNWLRTNYDSLQSCQLTLQQFGG